MDWKRRSDQPQSRFEPDEGDTFEETDAIDASRYRHQEPDFVDASSYGRAESDVVDASSYGRQNQQRAAPATAEHASYDQTTVDPVFAERGRVRRERQGSSFNTQRFGSGSGRRRFPLTAVLIALGVAAIALIGLLYFFTGGDDDPVAGASQSPSVVASRSPSTSPSASPSASATPRASPTPSPSPSAAAGTYVVTGTDTDGVFLREGPSSSATIITTLPEGTQVQITGVTTNADGRDWRQISAPQAGWVAAEFLQPAQQ